MLNRPSIQPRLIQADNELSANPETEIHKLNHIIELAFYDLEEMVNAACTNRDPDVSPRRRQAVAYALYELRDQAEVVLDAYVARLRAGRAAA